MYLDATIAKVRSEGRVINKSAYLAIGINLEGIKDVLGICIEQTEGAKFWLKIMTEIKNRGVKDIFIACVDGLKGFPEAIEATFPKTEVQLCVVHMIRNSLRYVSWKDRKTLASDLKSVYHASSEDEARKNSGLLPASGTAAIRRSPNPGRPTGSGSSRFFPISRRSAGSFTQPMLLNP